MASTKTVTELWKLLSEGKTFDSVLRKVKIVSAGEGKCTAEMTVGEEHTNRVGTLHGGYTATLVDMVTSMALYTSKRGVIGVSVDLHISYLKAVPLGKQIIMEAKTNKVGKTMAFLDLVIKAKDTSEIIATGSHTKFVGS